MYKIVIIDDEKMIREGLVNTMPWKEMGIKVVGSANNGQTALEIIREKKPHIVLTDIRMPKMDGLQLIRTLREEMPMLKIVILSGYDDFSYAQQAIKYDVVDYLVKPVEAEVLQELMEKLKMDLDREIFAQLNRLNVKTKIETEVRQYIIAIRMSNKDKALDLVDRIFHNQIVKSAPLEQLKNLCTEIVDDVLFALKQDGIQLNDELQQEYSQTFLEMFHLLHGDELMKWLCEFTVKIIQYIDKEKEDSSHMAIKKALEYIDGHFNEDLSIQKVAEEVHLSSNYFSHIFKKYKGQSFTDYLNNIRIQKAKKLLAENLYKIYEISDMVGYSDYKYFSSVFKKIEGISPSEYTELLK
jgi:two-component system response regulator YesN